MKIFQLRYHWLIAAFAAPLLMGAKGGCGSDVTMGELSGGSGGNTSSTSTTDSGQAPIGGPVTNTSAVGQTARGGSGQTPIGGPVTNAVDAAETANSVTWKTETVSLTANNFELVVDGQRYLTDGAVDVHSDPGFAEYTSLELIWQEHEREMRLFIYFEADATHWWSSEIRTYDGQTNSDWIYYYGQFFDMPLGQPFIGDLELYNNGPDDLVKGSIRFQKLVLLPSFKP